MNKTRKRQLHIRNKLIAAVAMLLVSSIMMVSTTYAWFTLSTAPEVQGITTTVGTNGNLEIALSPLDGVITGITTAVGDSANDWFVKNTSWGNLVDLSSSEYELGKIALMPSQLVISGGKIDGGGLAYPQYGSDGRISRLNTNTQIGVKVKNTDNAVNRKLTEDFRLTGTGYGVRAIGTSSGLSETERIFNAGVSALRTGMNQASGVASEVMNSKGQALANMMVEHALAEGEDKNDYKGYMEDVGALLTSLEQSVDNIDSALKGALKAVAATKISGTLLNSAVTMIDGSDDVSGLIEQLTGGDYAEDLSGQFGDFTQVVEKRDAIAEKVTAARGKYDIIKNNTSVSWTEIYGVVSDLMNVTKVSINDLPYDTITNTSDGKNQLIQSMINSNMKANLKLNEGSGIYYDIHVIASKIYATTKMSVDASKFVSGFSVITVDAIIETTYGGATMLGEMLAEVNTMTPKEEGASATSVSILDVYYGYILDFVFRTNAAGSSLQLQTEAANRVYSTGGAEATMGGGSTITFQVPAGVDSSIVMGTIKGIRLVFFDTQNGTVYGTAKATSVATETTDAGITLIGKLELCNTSTDAEGKGYITVGDAKGDATLCALNQNAPKAVSVMVSLDGNDITNSDILADGNLSGVLNLQFSSSVNLVPMENTALKNMKTFDVKIGDVKIGSVEEGGSYTYTFEKDTIESVTVTMGGNAVNNAYNAETGVLKVENVTGELVITVVSNQVNVTYSLDSADRVTVNGAATAKKNTDFTFTVTATEGNSVTAVSYKVGTGNDVALTGTDNSYTIPADAVTGDITISVTTGAATQPDDSGAEGGGDSGDDSGTTTG